MALVDISREAVLTAINEFDRVGRKAFLEKYGFEPSRRYRIRHDGQLYDSKAISGAAHAHLPGQGPLKASEFSGGVEHAVGVLRRLGFEVIDEHPADPVEAIVSVIANLRVAPVAGKPMLKQAIVLLWAIGQARAGADRLIEWTETVAALTPLLEEHRREGERRQGRPDYPIAALFHAGIWDLPGHTDVPRAHGDSAVRTWFAERSPQGGLPQPTYALARRSGAARVRMIDAITTRFFDDYDETGLLTAVGLYDEEVADDVPSSGRPSQDAVPEATSASPQADYARLCELVARRETRLHGQRRTRIAKDPIRLGAARQAVLLRSGGRCENPGCGKPAPDHNDRGQPLLEVDHVAQLADGGRDNPFQMIALCPNCHRVKTYGRKRHQLIPVLTQTACDLHERWADAVG